MELLSKVNKIPKNEHQNVSEVRYLRLLKYNIVVTDSYMIEEYRNDFIKAGFTIEYSNADRGWLNRRLKQLNNKQIDSKKIVLVETSVKYGLHMNNVREYAFPYIDNLVKLIQISNNIKNLEELKLQLNENLEFKILWKNTVDKLGSECYGDELDKAFDEDKKFINFCRLNILFAVHCANREYISENIIARSDIMNNSNCNICVIFDSPMNNNGVVFNSKTYYELVTELKNYN